MASLINSLYTGASAIYSNQTAVQVSGNNISNASTEGYSRQVTSITSGTSLNYGDLVLGTGCSVDSVERAENPFVTQQLVSQSANYGEYSAQEIPLNNIEQVLAIDEASLSGDIDAFFDAWEELSSNPDGMAEREQVLSKAENLVYQCLQISQSFSEVSESINSELESMTPELNDQLQQIAELNSSIQRAEVAGGDANTLRDQRDLLAMQVSESIGATTYTDGDGMLCLQLPNGLPLVAGDQSFIIESTRSNGAVTLNLTSGSTTYSLTGDDIGGSAKGLITVRDSVIPELRNDIDFLVYELANTVNALHQTGIDQGGATAGDLFSLTPPVDPTAPAWEGASASITVSIDDPSLIATGTSGTTGDNSLALEIASLDETTTINNSTFTGEYSRIAAKAGLLVSSNAQQLNDSETLLLDTTNKRDALSGVSLDEEMLLLVQYQTGYEAASRYLLTIQEMLDTLMNI